MRWLSWLASPIPQRLATCENCGVWGRFQVAGMTLISETPSKHLMTPQYPSPPSPSHLFSLTCTPFLLYTYAVAETVLRIGDTTLFRN